MSQLFQPSTIAEISAIVREHSSVIPLGGRTALDMGMPAPSHAIAIELAKFNHVIDYPHDDMTVTVQAGLKVADLQKLLASKGQTLPIDLALPDRATIGGAVAVNACGPRRLGHGTLRDYLIGISFIADSGEETKAGGRVVKNVAGYDLMKLMLGSLGRFGVITQLTFKVKPLPESTAVATFEIDKNQIAMTLDRLHATNARPIAVDLVNQQAARELGWAIQRPWLVVCAFEEKRLTVEAQLETLGRDFPGAIEVFRDDAAKGKIAALTDYPCTSRSPYLWRTIVRPSEVAECLSHDQDHSMTLHAMSGVVWQHSESNARPHPYSVARRQPAERLRPELFEPTGQSDTFLRDRIVKQLDPHGKFRR